jgi:hypothetical protein
MWFGHEDMKAFSNPYRHKVSGRTGVFFEKAQRMELDRRQAVPRRRVFGYSY